MSNLFSAASLILTFVLGCGGAHASPVQIEQITRPPPRTERNAALQSEIAVVKAPLPLCNNVELELVPTTSGVNVVLDAAGLVCIMADVFTGGLFTGFIDRGFFNGQLRPREFIDHFNPYTSHWMDETMAPEPEPMEEAPPSEPEMDTPELARETSVAEIVDTPVDAPVGDVEVVDSPVEDVEIVHAPVEAAQGPILEDAVEGAYSIPAASEPSRALHTARKEIDIDFVPLKTLDLPSLSAFFDGISRNTGGLTWTPITRMYMNAVLGTDQLAGPGPLANVVTHRLSSISRAATDSDVLNAILATGGHLAEPAIYKLMHERVARLRRQASFLQSGGIGLAGEISGHIKGSIGNATALEDSTVFPRLPTDMIGAESLIRQGTEQAQNIVGPATEGLLETVESISDQLRGHLQPWEYSDEDPGLPPPQRMVRR